MKKVAVYCRVSTAEQNTGSQVSAITEYCTRNKWAISKIYEDNGISGKVDDRPALNQLKKDCSKGKFQSVIVFRFDRMARSSTHLLECLELFRKNGIDFISISEGIDTSTAVGKMVFTFLSAISEFERVIIQERVKAGITRAKSAGVHCGRPRKGFDIAEALKLKKGGLGYKQISKKLGIPRATLFRYLSPLIQENT